MGRELWRGVVLLLILLGSSQSGWAQVVDPTVNEELYRRNQRIAEERRIQEQTQDIFLQEKGREKQDHSLPVEAVAFPIRQLELEGQQAANFPWAQKILNEYTGKKIGIEGLQLIAKRLSNAYIIHGYVTTRIQIPAQDLSTGRLRLQVIPGIIGEIRCNSEDKSKYWYTALPMKSGDILNLRDLEQGLEQLKRVPSQDATIKILPGKKTGVSDIEVIIRKEKAWRFGVFVDDAGSKATGKLQSGVSLSLDNVLGMNDLLYVSSTGDLDRKGDVRGTKGHSIYYSIPYGYWTVSLSQSYYQYHQTVQGSYSSFQYSGQSNNWECTLQRMIHRDQVSKTGLQWRIIKHEGRSFIEDLESPIMRKNTTAEEVTLFHRHNYGNSILDVQLSHRWGVPWFNAQPEIQGDGPTTRYKMWLLDATISRQIQLGKAMARYSCNLKVQHSKDSLYALDFFSMGNRYTVRGFDGEQTLAAEQGWLLRNELSVAIGKGREGYIGLDYGQVRGFSEQYLQGRTLAGVVLGMRGSQQGFSYEIFTGWPLIKPADYRTDHSVFGFQLQYQY